MRTNNFSLYPEISAAFLLIVVLVASGCGGDGEINAANNDMGADEMEINNPDDGDTEPGAVEIDDTANGDTVRLAMGEELVLRLESNPSTGYSWQLVKLEGGVLAQQGEAAFVSEAEKDMVGAGGVEVFRFLAERPGTVELTLENLRPWEEGVEPVRVFNVTVEVGE